MCGIAGIVAKRSIADDVQLEELVTGIIHRGMDDQGKYLSPRRNCALGHARLAILDLSAAGHQPMVDDQTGNAIVFNGEIYNFFSLRKECELAGYRFRSHSDTEVILALYHRHGTDCLSHLRGMFAFAIWDEQRQCLFFARDRIGKKPFHYAISTHGFVFCSEIDPLARHPWTSRSMDMQALDFYLHLQYIPAPLSIYRGIRKLPPAHYGVLDASGLRIEPYWQLDYREKIGINEDEVIDAFEEKLSEAVRLRMVADVPVGALLSGGVDSSLIVALMAKHSAAPVHTFSIGFTESAFDESRHAREAAETCGTLHHQTEMDVPDLDVLPLLARHYGEPYGDSSALPSFAVCTAARKNLKVVLNGDGGDELMGGYPRYALTDSVIQRGTWLFRHRASSLIDPAKWLGRTGVFPFKKLWRLALQNLLPDAGSFSMYGGTGDDAFRRKLLDDPSLEHNLSQWRADWFRQARMSSHNPIDSMLWLDNHTYLPGDLLVKMDIASMHCGLETRSPFLDHELIEFCARLPVNLKVRNRVGKYLVKRLAERHFPLDFVHRKKMGFGIPLLHWLRGPMLPLVRDVLRDPQTMNPLNHGLVLQNLSGFETGMPAIHPARIWMLLMFGLWRRHCCPV